MNNLRYRKRPTVQQRVAVSSPYYAIDGQQSKQPLNAENAPSSMKQKFTDKDFFSKLFTKSNYSVNGALVGGAIGMGVALYKRNHYFIYTFVGGVVGVIATSILMKNYTFEKKVKTQNK